MTRRKLFILSFGLMCSLTLSAQLHRVGVGVSVGAHTMFADTALNKLWGPTVGIEGYYACLFPIGNSGLWMGPRTGLEAAWLQGGWETPVSNRFSSTDYLNHSINYTVKGSVRETHNDISLAVPVMVALKYKGIMAGLGVKARGVVWSSAKTNISELNTSAYYPDFDVIVTNEPKLGAIVDAEQEIKDSRTMPEWHVAVAAEIGYEFEVVKYQFLGLRLFATYDVWNSYKLEDSLPRIYDIQAPDAATMAVSPVLNPLYKTALTQFNTFTIGVTISYIFEIYRESHHCNCLPY